MDGHDALKNPCPARLEYSLTESALFPLQSVMEATNGGNYYLARKVFQKKVFQKKLRIK
jgi:hypothetical protein